MRARSRDPRARAHRREGGHARWALWTLSRRVSSSLLPHLLVSSSSPPPLHVLPLPHSQSTSWPPPRNASAKSEQGENPVRTPVFSSTSRSSSPQREVGANTDLLVRRLPPPPTYVDRPGPSLRTLEHNDRSVRTPISSSDPSKLDLEKAGQDTSPSHSRNGS